MPAHTPALDTTEYTATTGTKPTGTKPTGHATWFVACEDRPTIDGFQFPDNLIEFEGTITELRRNIASCKRLMGGTYTLMS